MLSHGLTEKPRCGELLGLLSACAGCFKLGMAWLEQLDCMWIETKTKAALTHFPHQSRSCRLFQARDRSPLEAVIISIFEVRFALSLDDWHLVHLGKWKAKRSRIKLASFLKLTKRQVATQQLPHFPQPKRGFNTSF